MANYLEQNGYKAILLIGPTVSRIRSVLTEIFSNLKNGDTFVFYAASHGVPEPNGETGVVLSDTSWKGSRDKIIQSCKVPASQDILSKQAADYCGILKNALSVKKDIIDPLNELGITNLNVAIILDTCFSAGAFYDVVPNLKGTMAPRVRTDIPYKRVALTATSKDYEAQGGSVRLIIGIEAGNPSSRTFLFGQSRSLNGGQAYEDDTCKNHGVFMFF